MNTFYYKVNTQKEGVMYYKIQVLTSDEQEVNKILDGVNEAEGVFIDKHEFDNNIRNPHELDMKSINDNSVLGKITFNDIELFN